MQKLYKKFNKIVIKELQKDLKKENIYEVPRVLKVVVSTGIGNFKEDEKMIAKISSDLTDITGQKPKINKAKKAVSAFKLRIGQPIGLTVTLRGERMYDFIDRLVNVALPRVRDFRGIKEKAFDGRGNFVIGIKDQSIFPEVKQEESTLQFGFQINIRTSARDDAEAKKLLIYLGFPFSKKDEEKKFTEMNEKAKKRSETNQNNKTSLKVNKEEQNG